MADYNKLKVSELRDALSSRNLPTNGLKIELVARLVAADATASSAPPEKQKSSGPAPVAAHPPSVEEYEVDWDNDDTTSTVKGSVNAAVAGSTEAVPTQSKPQRKTIASLFETAPASAPQKSGNEPSSPSTVTDEATVTPAAPIVPTPSFAANLPTTSLDDEIARRKKRAERFGLSAKESEALKTLERQKRFGIAPEKEEVKTAAMKGLDEALPERKRKNEQQQQSGRGGKRGRFNDRDAPHGQQQQQQQQQRRRGRGGYATERRNGGVESGRVQKKVVEDPEERRKADERRKRFAGGA